MRTMKPHWWLVFVLAYIIIVLMISFATYLLSTEVLNIKRRPRVLLKLSIFSSFLYLKTLFSGLMVAIVTDDKHFDILMLLTNLILSILNVAGWAFIVKRNHGTAVIKTASVVFLCTFYIENFYTLFEQFTYKYMMPFYQSEYFEIQMLVPLSTYLVAISGSLLILLLIKKVSLGKYFNDLFSSKNKSIITLLICFLLGNLPYFLSYKFDDWQSSSYYITASLFAAFAVLIMFLYLAFYESSKIKIESQNALIVQQQAYVNSLENIQKEMRSFRHDYQNMMSGLYLQANEGDLEAVQNFIKKSVHYFDDHLGEEIKHITQISNIIILEVKSLILVKHMQAKEKQIDLQIEARNKLEKLGMGMADFMRCLGILLDNAMEAAVESEARKVRLLMLNEGDELSVVVENTFSEKPNLQEMWKQGYSSKGEKRGTGLSSYQNIIQRYPNAAINTVCKNDTFVQELNIKRSKNR